jgi:hypothetical protein
MYISNKPSKKPERSRWNATDQACHLLHAGYFFGLFFDPEDGSEMFFRNIC